MKKLINDPANVVAETLAGFQAAHADLVTVHFDPDYVVRADAPVKGKVGLVSGGGSGHEPLHAGYVGMGMLDAAVPGRRLHLPDPRPDPRGHQGRRRRRRRPAHREELHR